MLNGIIKRDGRVVMYDISKIKMAILKAMEADGKPDFAKADEKAAEDDMTLRQYSRFDAVNSLLCKKGANFLFK